MRQEDYQIRGSKTFPPLRVERALVWSGHSCPLACSATKTAGKSARSTPVLTLGSLTADWQVSVAQAGSVPVWSLAQSWASVSSSPPASWPARYHPPPSFSAELPELPAPSSARPAAA